MNTSLSWIKRYVPDLDVTAQEYTDAMTLSGTKVEGFERLDADLENIVIGQIEKIERHPDADKLIICQVNIGTETVQIVTCLLYTSLLWMPVLRTSARKRTVMRFSLLRMILVQFAKLWKKQVCLLQKHRLP